MDNKESGQSLVEFVLIAPAFFLLIFAIFQIGWQMNAQNITYQAARAAVDAEVTHNCQGGAPGAQAAQAIFTKDRLPSNAIVTVYPSHVCQGLTSGNYGTSTSNEVEVTVVAKSQNMAPVLGLPTFTSNITAKATAPLELG